MAQAYNQDRQYGSQLVGVPENVAPGMAQLTSNETPLLSIVSGNLDNLSMTCTNTTYSYHELQHRLKRTTLNGSVSSGVTTVVLTHEVAKPGDIIQVDKETILLGTSSDFLTFAGCTRSVGTGADADHVTLSNVLVLGKPWAQGSAAATADMVVYPDTVTAYTQIFRADIDVSGTAMSLPQYHAPGMDPYQIALAQQQLNLKHELENALLWGGAAQAPSTGATSGKFAGIYERIQSTSSTDCDGYAISIDNVRSALRGIKDYGGNPQYWFVNLYMQDVINSWQLPHKIVSAEESPFGVDTSVVMLGGVSLSVVPIAKIGASSVILSPEFIRVGPLSGRAFQHTYLGVTGDRVQGQVVGEYTCEVVCPRAHHWFYEVKES